MSFYTEEQLSMILSAVSYLECDESVINWDAYSFTCSLLEEVAPDFYYCKTATQLLRELEKTGLA